MAAWGDTILVKNAWMLLIKPFSVPRAPLIVRSAGTIVLEIAAPILLIAATMAPQSMPSCALTGCGAISDTISTSTRSVVRCAHKACSKFHFGFIPALPRLPKQRCRVLTELTHHVSLALPDCVCVRQDGRLLAQLGRQHPLHRGLILNPRDQPGAREVCRRSGRRLRCFILNNLGGLKRLQIGRASCRE